MNRAQSNLPLVDAKLDHLATLERARGRLQSETSLLGPAIEGVLALAGVGVAAASAAVSAPVLTLVGLCLAFGSATLAVRSGVQCQIKREELAELEEEIARLDTEIAALERDVGTAEAGATSGR